MSKKTNFIYDNLLISYIRLLKDNPHLNFKTVNLVLEKFIKYIWKKIDSSESLSKEESKLLIYSLYNFTINELDIDSSKIKRMKFIEDDDLLLPSGVVGIHRQLIDNTEEIYYHKEIIRKICDKKLNFDEKFTILQIICHELVHSKQTQDCLNNVINLNNFVCTLEFVSKSKFKNLFEDNYDYTRLESDAEVRSMNCLYSYMINYDLIKEDEEELYQKVIDNNNKKIEKSLKYMVEYNGEKVLLGNLLLFSCSKSIELDHELFNKYPLLSFAFNEDGSIKRVEQLLLEREENLLKFPNLSYEIDNIYKYILINYTNANVEFLDNIMVPSKSREKAFVKKLIKG